MVMSMVMSMVTFMVMFFVSPKASCFYMRILGAAFGIVVSLAVDVNKNHGVVFFLFCFFFCFVFFWLAVDKGCGVNLARC